MEYQGLDKTVGIEVGQILDFLKSELTGLGCQVEIKQRGFLEKSFGSQEMRFFFSMLCLQRTGSSSISLPKRLAKVLFRRKW